MRADKPKPTNKGFTLIELVVVTAVSGLLIAVLMPSLRPVRDQARRSVCAVNLQQQYIAASEYALDNDGFYPRGIMGRDHGPEYNVYATAILPYLGYEGEGPLWTSPVGYGFRRIIWGTNRILLDFDVFHCPGFPGDVYDDPNDLRYYYLTPEQEELYGPGGVNPLHYVSSAFPMPYPQSSIDEDEYYGPCWDEDADVQGHPSGDPDQYAPYSTLESFPDNCQPSSKIYVTGVDKKMPWVTLDGGAGGIATVGIRFYSVFLAYQLNHGGFPRVAEDWRHPGGLNALFFDGRVKPLPPIEMDPGCEVPLHNRIGLFSRPHDDWDGWDNL